MRERIKMTISPKVLAIALLLAGAAAAQDAPAPAVIVAPAQMMDLTASVQYNGRLEADSRVDLRPRVAGNLLEVAFAPSDTVEKDAVLFRIEDDLYRAAVQEAEGALKSANAERELARIERERQDELVRRQTGAQAMLDQAEAALDRAKLNLS